MHTFAFYTTLYIYWVVILLESFKESRNFPGQEYKPQKLTLSSWCFANPRCGIELQKLLCMQPFIFLNDFTTSVISIFASKQTMFHNNLSFCQPSRCKFNFVRVKFTFNMSNVKCKNWICQLIKSPTQILTKWMGSLFLWIWIVFDETEVL